MLTITRRQARRLRAVFRRHTLGIAHRGVVSPIVFRADPAAGLLRVRHHQAPLAVEHVLPGSSAREEVIAVPLDALADFEGARDDTPVILEAAAPGRTLVRWDDRGIPQIREYDVPDPATLPPFPAEPAYLALCPADLLDALAEAAATTDEGSTRYALDCIQLKATGEVVATDGRQILIHAGFHFPWEDDLLVRGTPLFASRALPRERSVQVGRTDAHVAVRAGDWTIWMTVRNARFPRTEHVVPATWAATTRLRLDPEDAAFLGRALDRLPGADVLNGPATLDLNGRVAVRARDEDRAQATELILARSGYTGEPVRVSANRAFLARAVRLGLGDFEIAGAGAPVVLRDARRVFCFQPLSEELAIEPTDDVTRVESTSAFTPPVTRPVANHPGESSVPEEKAPSSPPSKVDGKADVPAATAEVPGAGGLVALVQEAESLHEALADARARAGRLVVALRRHRKRERLVASTLATLRELKLPEAVG